MDDMCRGSRQETLCGGTYCEGCNTLIMPDEFTCEDCEPPEEDDEFYDANENEDQGGYW
jgi:hypothetical protein